MGKINLKIANRWGDVDIRVSEEHAAHFKPINEVREMLRRAHEEARRQGKPDMPHLESDIGSFREHTTLMQSSCRKPWPRPLSCGTVWMHRDSRMVRVVRQGLDILRGVLNIQVELAV